MRRLYPVLMLALCLPLLVSTAKAQQTFTVDRLTDVGEGEGLAGDLRYCITNANDGDTITFAVTGTISLTRALPTLTRSTSIQAPGASILKVRGNVSLGEFRVFTVGNATVSITGLAVTNGNVSEGGGIRNEGTLTISDSTISQNYAGCFTIIGNDGFGGGVYNRGTLLIKNSTIADNSAGPCFVTDEGAGLGAGIYNEGVLTISDSTISGNHASFLNGLFYAQGGGIYNLGTLIMGNSTVSANGVDSAPNGDAGGGIFQAGSLYMWNTVLSGNSAPTGPDLSGPITSSGYNLIGNTSGGSSFDPTDLLNVDPMLGPLQDNGGPTWTHALLPGSPAIDAGDPDFVGPPDFDQRGEGFPRVVNGIIDIGAFEVQVGTGIRRRQ